jgi:hypothetical protein
MWCPLQTTSSNWGHLTNDITTHLDRITDAYGLWCAREVSLPGTMVAEWHCPLLHNHGNEMSTSK